MRNAMFRSFVGAFALVTIGACNTTRETDRPGEAAAIPGEAAVAQARAFIAEYEAAVRPLEKSLSLAWWDANITGTDAAFKAKEESQNRLDAVLADPAKFKRLKGIWEALREGPAPPEPSLKRQIEVLYLEHLEKQVDPELLRRISAKGNAIEQAFNVYRAKVDGKELTDSAVRKVLKEDREPAHRKAVWEASKGVGAVVEKDLRDLVKLRNESARKLGFKDFHALELAVSEQSQGQVLRLFDELWELAREPYRAAKARIDAELARDFGLASEDLRPWHYQDPFFQEAPAVPGKSLDPIYAKLDLLKLCHEFYAGVGLPVEEILARSDLFEKKGKSPHAFSTDIDREGDVRVLANVVPTEYWMGTMLHELGHGVYSLYIPRSVPYALRIEAHPLTTEGLAMMFEKFSLDADWLEKMGVEVPDREALNRAGRVTRRTGLLVFAAWCQVMFRFEMALYSDPDQDLNKLWWDLVEKYQMIRRPEGRNAPDYGAKLHIVSAPCYYHNYQMGQLFASQLHHAIAREVLKADPAEALYNGRKEVGEFLRAKVFGPGRLFTWNGLARNATGEDLNARAFAADLKAE